MTRHEIRRANHERVGSWICHLTDEHATAFFLLGIGHDHATGSVHICQCEDIPEVVVLGFLREATRLLEERLGVQ